MKTHSLKLGELLNLEAELVGIINNQTGQKITEGLLSQDIPLIDKYFLDSLVVELNKEKKSLEAFREELIKKHGEADDNGNIGISMFLETGEVDAEGNPQRQINPKYVEFNDAWQKLLSQEKKMELYNFPLSNLEGIKTKESYPLVFRYLVEKPKSYIEEITVEEVK